MNKSIKRTIATISMTAMLAAGFAMPVSAATQVEVTGNPVMIRADAGLKNTVVSRAHKGDRYAYVGQKKDATGRVWYNIRYSGNKTGWITSQFAKKTETAAEQPAAVKQVQITATPVNVRSGAGTSFKKLGKTSKGKTFTYLASKKDSSGRVWYQIQYTSQTKGWVMGSLSKLVGETATANPVKAYEGTYQYGRATLTVKASGKSDAKMTVTWGSSAWENSVWEMSGMFDPSVYRVDYGNGVRTDYVYDDNGSVSSRKVAYKNSTGRVQFKDTKTLVWRDENEPEHGEMTFTKISDTVTEPEQPAATAKLVQITGSVNVRSGAGTKYKKLGSTSKGKKYTYLASKKASNGRVWYQIQFTSKTKGWVSSGYAKLVNGTTNVKDTESSALMQGVYKKLTAADSTYTEWKSGFNATTFAQKLDGETIVITAKGEEGLNGTYTFKHDGDYITYTSGNKEDYSGYSVFMFIRDAVGDYYGMNSTLMNGYLAGLQNFGFENKYLNIDMEKGEYKIYSASKWDMKELDEMYVNDAALEYTSALTEDYVNKIINSGKVTVVTYGSKNHLKMFVYEYGNKNTDLTYKSIMTVMNKLKPTDYELFNKHYTELKEVKDADGFTVTFGLDKSLDEAETISGVDGYSCVTIVYDAVE
ncbi:MAG: SH3 domain-containing protein [Clostridia bacterium]|nr:SH3 domain-containing protein [Clostridia bacterium]